MLKTLGLVNAKYIEINAHHYINFKNITGSSMFYIQHGVSTTL